MLAEMTAVALVPTGSTAERALEFKQGGLGRCDLTEVAAVLAQTYPGASLVVELPLWRSDDPGVPDGDLRILICGNEVYATCHLGGSLNSIEKTLRLADPSFMYNAIILEHKVDFGAGSCPADSVAAGTARVRAILVGAYDGEGFVLASARQPS